MSSAVATIGHVICRVDHCERAHYARGWCRMHYRRWMKHGTTALQGPPPDAERFWAKVAVGESDACWEWQASLDGKGYGQFFPTGRRRGGVRAHRWAFEDRHGPIPPGRILLHECDNPRCVNPDHLRIGTQADNVRDMWDKNRHPRGRQYVG
jgi:hypothetical protein